MGALCRMKQDEEKGKTKRKQKVLMAASVASMIDQFNLPNIRLLLQMGYEVHVACNFAEGNTCDKRRIGKLRKELGRLGVKPYQWDCPRNAASGVKCLRAYRQLWRLTQREQFAWMHCQSPVGGVLARLIAHRRGIPVVYTAHGFHFYRGAPWKNWVLYYPVEKLLSYWTDVLVTVNREDERFAKRHLNAKKVFYIPGVGVDTARFQKENVEQDHTGGSLRKKYGVAAGAVLLLSVGELNPGKNHRTVIAALAAMQNPQIYYIICGQGGQRRKLLRYAYRLGVGGRIRLVGYQEQMELFYQAADLFVFPSVREGMPVALIEAMAAGLPCVVSDIRGNRELVEPKKLRFSPKCQKQLVKILNALIGDRSKMQGYGRANQRKAREYRLELVQRRMYKIYTGMSVRRPAVSILIAVYQPNFAWLKELFVSILHQSFQDYEILLMDDGSGQDVYNKVRQLAEEAFGRPCSVTLLQSKDNEGSDRTFEKLAGRAAGEYIAFCDQDDIWEPEKLELLVKALRHKDVPLAYSDMSVIDADGRTIYKSLRGMRKCLHFVSGKGMTVRYIMDNCTAACSMLVRRELVQKAMPFYQGVFCDQWIAAYAAAYGKIVFVDMPLVKYRRHNNNQSGTFRGISTKEDYRKKRILPAYGMVQELKRRRVHYPREKEMQAFVLARKRKDAVKIFQYRKYNRKYAYFDLLMLCIPDALAETILAKMQRG